MLGVGGGVELEGVAHLVGKSDRGPAQGERGLVELDRAGDGDAPEGGQQLAILRGALVLAEGLDQCAGQGAATQPGDHAHEAFVSLLSKLFGSLLVA